MQAVVQWNVTPNRPASDGDPHRPNARTGFPIAHACAWTGGTSRIWLTPYRKQMMRTLQGSARARSRRHWSDHPNDARTIGTGLLIRTDALGGI